jgi:hypothetical protein
MKQIKLSGKKEIYALVDDVKYEELRQNHWRLDGKGYAICGKEKIVYMHRQIMGVNDPMIEVDHIHGNKLDNRQNELRLCTKAQNQQNKGKQKNNTSGYKGVSFHKRLKKWQVLIQANRKNNFVGYFFTIQDAVRAYNAAAIKYHGEFAFLQ